MADCDKCNSCAASVKLSSRAADSNARSSTKFGIRRMRVPSPLKCFSPMHESCSSFYEQSSFVNKCRADDHEVLKTIPLVLQEINQMAAVMEARSDAAGKLV